MTVDSEAIFAVAAHSRNNPRALEQLRGSMAAAWIDERERDLLFAARGVGRPLWTGEGRDCVFVASTKLALEVVERYCEIDLRKRELHEGTFLILRDGKVVRREAFRAHISFLEPDPLPAVRAPDERDFCLSALASIAAALAASSQRRRQRAVSATSTPSRADGRATRNWNVAHAPRRASNIR